MSNDEIVGSLSALVAAVVWLAVALARTRERLVRLEEWVREHGNGTFGAGSK